MNVKIYVALHLKFKARALNPTCGARHDRNAERGAERDHRGGRHIGVDGHLVKLGCIRELGNLEGKREIKQLTNTNSVRPVYSAY